MTKKDIDKLAEELQRRWQDHGRLYSTALFEYSRWSQMIAEEQNKQIKRMWFHLNSLKDWMDRMENYQPNTLDKLNEKNN